MNNTHWHDSEDAAPIKFWHKIDQHMIFPKINAKWASQFYAASRDHNNQI